MKTKKKKKKPVSMVYVERHRKWMTIKEAVDRDHNPEKYEDESVDVEIESKRKEADEFSEVHELIADFISKQDHKRGYIRRAGPLKGKKKLASVLREEGYSRSADRLEDGGLKDAVESAWRLYRKQHPINYHKLELEMVQQHETPTGRRRNKLWGIPVSAIIRFMGKEDFEFDEAKKSLAHLGIQVEDTTIRGQLWCGTQRGKYGKVAHLEDWQIEKLFEYQKVQE
jgi:hypothetical protein